MRRSDVTLLFSCSCGHPNERLVVAESVWKAVRKLAGFRFDGHLTSRQAARFARQLRQGMTDLDQRPGRASARRFFNDAGNRAKVQEIAAFCEQGRGVLIAPRCQTGE